MSTLRAQTVTPDQSRPTTRETKKVSLLWGRLKPRRNTTNTSGSSNMSIANSRRSSISRSFRKRQMAVTTSESSNLMQWLERDCPQDLIPKILAYSGPQTTAALAGTNRFWFNVIDNESTWRTMCEDLYKWKEGDEIPISWKDYYKFNPCVPVDYPTVSAAFSVARSPRAEQCRSIRVLLRPGRYILREAITVQAPCTVRVEMETMEMPESFHPLLENFIEAEPSKKRATSLRKLLACRTVDVEDPDEDLLEFMDSTHSTTGMAPTTKRATLILRTRRNNEPIIRVRQGCCMLRNMELIHISNGLDIWNGNAAVQIQPPIGPDDQPMLVLPAPTAVLDRLEITSASGRGIVNIDGGHVTIRNCYVHDCAATGIYVGGPGSRAIIERTDVVRNGNGNTQNRRGIARGHSGIYLEQGHAFISECNISHNSLTGISAVSPSNAILNLESSDLVANGTFQLEMPAMGSEAHNRSSTLNNTLASTGSARSRSGLIMEG